MNKRHISKIVEDIEIIMKTDHVNILRLRPEQWMQSALSAEELSIDDLAELHFKYACLAEEAANVS